MSKAADGEIAFTEYSQWNEDEKGSYLDIPLSVPDGTYDLYVLTPGCLVSKARVKTVEGRGRVAIRLRQGDLNGDNVINGVDESILRKLAGAQYRIENGCEIGAYGGPSPLDADLNGDLRVDASDMAILRRNLGQKSPAYPILVDREGS